MEAEKVINLFDWQWFSSEFFKKSSNPPRSSACNCKENPSVNNTLTRSELDFHLKKKKKKKKKKMSGDCLSPDSVMAVFSDTDGKEDKGKVVRGMMKMRRSLSELEFEEVKGFMDMGFVFSEEDEKNSRLVDIIPGLKNINNNNNSVNLLPIVERRRPYLSEAWEEELDTRKRMTALMKWRIPDFTNEIDMKNNLRNWVRNVAATLE